MNKRIIIMFICIVFASSALPSSVLPMKATESEPETELHADITAGGRGYSVHLFNVGEADAYNVNITWEIKGGLLNRTLAVYGTGFPGPLKAGESMDWHKHLFGLGKFVATVTVSASNAKTYSWSRAGTVIFIIALINPH